MYSTRNRDTAMLWKQYKTKVLQNNFKRTLVPRTTVTKKNALISTGEQLRAGGVRNQTTSLRIV